MTRIDDAVAVVTGGGSGIGRALAAGLVRAGARVAVADIELDAAESVAAEIGAVGFRADVGDPADMQRLAADVRERVGEVGILCNNAGVASVAPLVEMTDDDWSWLLRVNLYGALHGVAAFLPQLRERRGHILNSGSMAGLSPDAGMGGYGVTKFALTAYTEVLAAELADDGVGVTLLAPGPVRTRLGSSSRNRPTDLAGNLRDVDLSAGAGGGMLWMDPAAVADVALAAIAGDRLYAITHRDWLGVVERRHRAIETAFRVGRPDLT